MEHKNIKKSVLNDKKYIKNDYKGVEIVLFTPFFTRIKKHDCNKLHRQRHNPATRINRVPRRIKENGSAGRKDSKRICF